MGSPTHDYASKGVAGTGLGLGIAGTALGLLNGANCGNGLLGGLFGGNCCSNNSRMGMGAELQYISELQSKVAKLESEKYSDINDKAVYQQTLSDNKDLRNEFFAFVKPIADEVANNRVELARIQEQLKCCCEKQELQTQITAGKINETALALNGKIDTMNANYQGTFNSLNATIACIQSNMNNITKVVIPNEAVCPGWGNVTITPTTTATTASA